MLQRAGARPSAWDESKVNTTHDYEAGDILLKFYSAAAQRLYRPSRDSLSQVLASHQYIEPAYLGPRQDLTFEHHRTGPRIIG